jgi:NADPH-dependent F420 reductase
MEQKKQTIAVIGGTGALGSGLARRWAAAGYPVVLGSRKAEKAVQAAQEMNAGGFPQAVRGMANGEAAGAGDIVVMTVPFAHHEGILAEIREAVQGKIVVDATAPLVPPKVGRVQLPESDSAACMAQDALGENVRVVSAFQNVSAHKLDGHEPVDCDVLVCGDKKEARQVVVDLIAPLGLRGVHAGPLANSTAAEALTSVLITINRLYKTDGAGIRITGNLENAPVGSPQAADARP